MFPKHINNKSSNNTKKKLLFNDNYLELCNQIINTLASFLRRFTKSKNNKLINQKMRNLKEELKASKINYTNNGRKLYNQLPGQVSQPNNEIGSFQRNERNSLNTVRNLPEGFLNNPPLLQEN